MEAAVSGRIRGHYRIDSSGRVEPLADVNAEARPYALPQVVPLNQRGKVKSRLNRRSIAGASIFILGIGMLFAMPQIEQAMLSAQSAHVASVPAKYVQKHPGLKTILDNYF
jgi:hypothetical protein